MYAKALLCDGIFTIASKSKLYANAIENLALLIAINIIFYIIVHIFADQSQFNSGLYHISFSDHLSIYLR